MNKLKKIISGFKNSKILVVGDLILDKYIYGDVDRVSPEAPVPIVLQREKDSYKPGGAANVANNLVSLGAKVSVAGKVGKDSEGKELYVQLENKKIDTDGVFEDKDIPTILKTRIIAGNQQVVRVDRENALNSGDNGFNQKIRKYIREHIDSFDAVIISDYGKGLINPALVADICSLAIQKKKIITVDPKVEHFTYYSRVTGITPNKKEVENAIRNIKIKESHKLDIHTDKLDTLRDIDLAGQQLLKSLELKSLLMTLGEAGMRLFEQGKKPYAISTKAREVFDVTGAGDTVISVFTLSLSSGATKREAADLANYAAGIVVGRSGASVVTQKELLNKIDLENKKE